MVAATAAQGVTGHEALGRRKESVTARFVVVVEERAERSRDVHNEVAEEGRAAAGDGGHLGVGVCGDGV